MILLDTNVLVYTTYENSVQHAASKQVVDAVIQGRLVGAIVPQILVEFIAATTGPAIQDPLPLADAITQARAFGEQIRLLEPPLSALTELYTVLSATGRAGRRTFDCFLAAQARALGIAEICTYNQEDFAGIPGVAAILPGALLDRLEEDESC